MVWNVYYEDILLCFSNIRRRLAADRQAPFDKDRVQSPFKVHKSFFSYVRCTTNSDDANDNRKNMETKKNSQNVTSVKATPKIHTEKGHLCNEKKYSANISKVTNNLVVECFYAAFSIASIWMLLVFRCTKHDVSFFRMSFCMIAMSHFVWWHYWDTISCHKWH